MLNCETAVMYNCLKGRQIQSWQLYNIPLYNISLLAAKVNNPRYLFANMLNLPKKPTLRKVLVELHLFYSVIVDFNPEVNITIGPRTCCIFPHCPLNCPSSSTDSFGDLVSHGHFTDFPIFIHLGYPEFLFFLVFCSPVVAVTALAG